MKDVILSFELKDTILSIARAGIKIGFTSASCGQGSYSDTSSHEIVIIDDGPCGNNTFGI